MIKGRGLLAKSLRGIDSDKYFFYVNGISNSVLNYIPEDNFEVNEIKGVSKNIGNKILVYFSTIQVNAEENYNRPYVHHKQLMEYWIKELFSNYVIVRTSNLVGHNPWNNNTLFNYLYNSLKEGTEIGVIETAQRNILDIDHFIRLLDYYLKHFHQNNNAIDIINPVSYNMAEILAGFEMVFSKHFKKNNLPDSIAYFKASTELSSGLVNSCKINLENYLEKVLKKYYQPILSKINQQ